MHINELLVAVNEVTVFHRHKKTIPKKYLDNLCEAQIEFEKHLAIVQQPLSGSPEGSPKLVTAEECYTCKDCGAKVKKGLPCMSMECGY